MRKIILLSTLCLFVLKAYSQCPTCHDGGHFPDANSPKMGKALLPDSSGGLAQSYILQNVCGLNWVQSSILTTTRYPPTPGTGLPGTVPITFDSCGSLDSIVKAFLYFNGSLFVHNASDTATATITNPASQTFSYTAHAIGFALPKCWGEDTTVAYRCDITSAIYGGGNYIVNLNGYGITSESMDGITIVLIYIDKSAHYSGSIVLWDGLYTNFTGTSHSQTFSGFNVCNATPTGQAFSILADMQNNISATNTETYNGSTGTFPNLFYNFCTVTTSLTAAQTSTTYSVYTNDVSDCYSWVLAGLYWQNTNCTTCHPSISGTLPLNITPPTDTICQGDSVQLAASGANTYTWGPATGLSCTACPNPKASPNATTTYSLTGFDGCAFGEDTIQIVVSPKATPTVTPANPSICEPGSVQLTATGGANYVWKPSATLSCDSCANPIASPTVTTTYTVVSGYKGCKDSTTVTVTVSSSPSVSALPKSPTICVGQSVKLTASGASNYKWSPAASLSCNNCSNPTATPTVTTVYTLVGSNGICADTITDTVFTVPPPVAAINPKADSVCQGDSVLLTASGGLTYLWSTGKTTSTIKVAPNTSTIYTLVASNGVCTDSTAITVKITPTITAVSSIIDSIICPYDSSFLTVTASGGPATYLWNTGATTSSIEVNDTVTTIYTVTAKGLCNSIEKTIKVTVIPLPKPIITGTNWKCANQKDTLTVSSSINPATYLWYNGATGTSTIIGPIEADSVVHVTVSNSLGCSVTVLDTILLRQPPSPTANPPAIFCAGQPITLTASATGTYPPFTYNWSTGQTGTSITINPGPDSTTTYTVSVSNGCMATAVTTAIPNTPILSACCNQTLFIEHDSANRHDTAILAAQGNSIKYQWEEQPSTGTITCLDPLCDSVMVITDVSTTYTVIGTDSNGCQTEQLLLVNIDIPCFNLTIPNVFTPTNAGIAGMDNIFYIRTQNIDAWELTIFDRWGKEVYHSTNPYQYWDGNTEGGAKAAAGVYYYVISATCQNTTYKKDGFVQLIR